MEDKPAVTEAGLYPRGFPLNLKWNWPLVLARKLVTLNYGRALKADTRTHGKVPVYGTNGQCGWHNEPLVKGPGVILGRKGQGPLGVEWCQSDFWVIDTAYFVSPLRPDLDLKYFYHLIKYVGLNHLKDGTSNPSLSRDTFGAQLLPLPPLPIQRAIAHILDTLDDKIELNRRMNETLEAMARALFQSWFVDFDPIRAKAEGRDTGLPPHIANLFPDRFEDSEFGEIPAGWKVRTIGELANVVGGSTPSTAKPEFWEDGTHCWATPKDLASLNAPVLLNTERRVTDAGLAQISSGLLPAGTVLLSSRAPIGYLAIAEVPTAINQGFIAMKPNASVSNVFLLLWARFAHEDILSRANGSTFLEISKANFRPLPLASPSAAVFKAFDALAQPLYRRIVCNERESRTLAALRDTRLPKLISGELRVKAAERLVEAAV